MDFRRLFSQVSTRNFLVNLENRILVKLGNTILVSSEIIILVKLESDHTKRERDRWIFQMKLFSWILVLKTKRSDMK